MNKKTLTKVAQKIVVIICIIMVLATTMPRAVFADDDGGWSLGGALLKEFMQLLSFLGDMAMGLLNNVMLGADGVGSAMLSYKDENLTNPESWIYLAENEVEEWDETFMNGEIDTKSFVDLGGADFEIPNMLYSPENIFANNIAALDINFLNPNTYQAVSSSEDATEKASSSATTLQPIIASWYAAFRNIAVVGLLTVLIYLGIRILLSSTAADKAQYKERLKDWFVALCLVFFIHFIMSGLLMITDRANALFSTRINEGYTVKARDDSNDVTVTFRTNLMGLMRFQAQSYDAQTSTAYTIIYIALVIYTFIFTFMYFKRFLYVAFFTMISPLVALTYPIDKAGDGKSQAFNMWFKEYTLNVIIQPIHLILYTVFVSSANDLAKDNPIYALVAIAFLIPAEKFIKKMFGLDQAASTGDFGSFAGGAMAMQGMNALGKALKGGSGNSGNKALQSGSDSKDEEGNGRIRQVDNKNELGSFQDSDNNNENGNQGPRWHTELTNEQRDALEADGIQPGDSEYDQYLRNHGLIPGQNENSNLNLQQNDSNDEEGELLETNGNNTPPIKPWAGTKLAIKGAKTLGKGVYKGAKLTTRIGMGAMGAAAGVAAGLTTGDASKVLQYGAAGAGVGYLAGRTMSEIPEKAINAAPGVRDRAFDKMQDIRETVDKALYGEDWAAQQRIKENNARERQKMLKDKDERKKYAKMAKDINYKIDDDEALDRFMNTAFDYKEQGVKDEEMIQNSLDFENRNGGIGGSNHNKQMEATKFAEDYGFDKTYILDEKKRAQTEGVAKTKLKTKKQQKELMKHLAGAHGLDKYYEQHSGL